MGKKSTKESETDNHRILESLKSKKETSQEVSGGSSTTIAFMIPHDCHSVIHIWYVTITISIDVCTFGAIYNSNRHFKLTRAKYTISKSMF